MGRPTNGRLGGVGGGGGGGNVARDMPAPPPKEAAKATSGEMAVRQSKRERAQQETVRVEDDEVSAAKTGTRKVGEKTFYLRDGAWIDSEFKPEAKLAETALDFGSDEYFALLKREPQLARFFSLGERVVVVYKGRVYRVNSKP